MNTLDINILSDGYVARALFWLITTTLVYFLMNGAQVFETALIVPAWTACPPESFDMFRGKYALDFKWFWIVFHSIHEITFLLAIFFCWKLPGIRSGLLVLFAVHFAVRAWTLAYFAPNIIAFQQIAISGVGDEDLSWRVTQWRNLNYLRVAIFVAVSLGLLPLVWRVSRMMPAN